MKTVLNVAGKPEETDLAKQVSRSQNVTVKIKMWGLERAVQDLTSQSWLAVVCDLRY